MLLGTVGIEYGRLSSGFTFFPTKLPTFAIDDVVKATDRSVRTDGSLLPPHKTDDALNYSPLTAFPANGHPVPSIPRDI